MQNVLDPGEAQSQRTNISLSSNQGSDRIRYVTVWYCKPSLPCVVGLGRFPNHRCADDANRSRMLMVLALIQILVRRYAREVHVHGVHHNGRR